MRRLFLAVIFGWLLLCALPAKAGVTIGGTRFIYSQGAHSLSVPLRNDSDIAWLVVTRVQPASRWPGAQVVNTEPFVVTPPMVALPAGQEATLRLIRAPSPLPEDHETLFTLSIATIPSGKTEGNRVQMGVRSALKLVYRPVGLKGDPQQAYQKLRWSATPSGVSVTNPTPWYITLFNLDINSRRLDNPGVVAPFATRRFTTAVNAATQIRWQTLNDYGRVMPPLTYRLNRTR